MDQSATGGRLCNLHRRTNSATVRWMLFSTLASSLLISGCATGKGARSGAKTSNKKSIVSKYQKDEESTEDDDKLVDKPTGDDIETRKLIRPAETTRRKDPSRFDGLFKHVDDEDAVGPRYVD